MGCQGHDSGIREEADNQIPGIPQPHWGPAFDRRSHLDPYNFALHFPFNPERRSYEVRRNRTNPALYMAWLDMKKDLPPTLILRGNQQSVSHVLILTRDGN